MIIFFQFYFVDLNHISMSKKTVVEQYDHKGHNEKHDANDHTTNLIKLNNKISLDKERSMGEGMRMFMGIMNSRSGSSPVTIKVISQSEMYGSHHTKYNQELSVCNVIMNNPHRNLIEIHDIIYTNKNTFTVMEYCYNGSLDSILINPIKENVALYYLKQLALGVKYLTDNNIMHRNIKPQNVMLTNNRLTLKITDFRLAKLKSEMTRSNTICGSPLYMAPEILNRLSYDDGIDVWSIGMIFYEMLFGIHPFRTCRDYEELRSASETHIKIPPNNKIKVSSETLSLLKMMLAVDGSDRISIDDILRSAPLNTITPIDRISLKNIFVEMSDSAPEKTDTPSTCEDTTDSDDIIDTDYEYISDDDIFDFE